MKNWMKTMANDARVVAALVVAIGAFASVVAFSLMNRYENASWNSGTAHNYAVFDKATGTILLSRGCLRADGDHLESKVISAPSSP